MRNLIVRVILLFIGEQVKERSKSHAKNKKKLDEQYESQEKSASQEKPKKKVLFQVDINMDSKYAF